MLYMKKKENDIVAATAAKTHLHINVYWFIQNAWLVFGYGVVVVVAARSLRGLQSANYIKVG